MQKNRPWARSMCEASRVLDRAAFGECCALHAGLHPPSSLYCRNVVAVEGDSAFGFSGMECETMCR